jgi:hypothetical protein
MTPRSIRAVSFSALALLSLAACSGEPTQPATPQASPAVQARVLTASPGNAVGVLAAKQDGPQERVVVHGRIASIVKGYAAFTLMDTKLPYCGEVAKEDTCKTPWDYCCESSATRTEHALAVELRDANGKPLSTPSLPDLRLLDEVDVVGKISKDEHGNFVLAAEGMIRTARPNLPEDLRWPQ